MIKKLLIALLLLQAVAASAALPSPATGVSPTNSPTDGYTIYATGSKSKWGPAAAGGSATNAIGTVLTNGVPAGTGLTEIDFTNYTIAPIVSGGRVVVDLSSPGGGGSQTPWIGTVNGAGFNLTNGGYFSFTGDSTNGGNFKNGGNFTNAGTFSNTGNLTNRGTAYFHQDVNTEGQFNGDGGGLNNLDAGGLNFGTVAPARLGSGSSISTKFLRGDSTWQNVEAAGAAAAATNSIGLASGKAAFRDTNSLVTPEQAFDIFDTNTVSIGALATPSVLTLFAVDENTNAVPVHPRNNLTLTSDGRGGFYLDGSAGGGGSSYVVSNLTVSSTAPVILDFNKGFNVFKVLEQTNTTLIASNTSALLADVLLYIRQDTNGTHSTVLTNQDGLVQTNVIFSPTTNANAYDIYRLQPGFFTTNVAVISHKAFAPNVAVTGGGGGGGGGTYVLVNTTNKTGAANGGTTDPMDTTGASTLFITEGSFNAIDTPSDLIGGVSSGNTWICVVSNNASGYFSSIWKVVGANVGANHTFTCNGTSHYASFQVLAYSGGAGTTDHTNSFASGGISTINSGSITPSENNCLVISSYVSAATTTPTVSPLTLRGANQNTGGSEMAAGADQIQTTATAVNAGWDSQNGGGGTDIISCIADFLP